jgi:gamma-glutamylcyclotransferase (GGCT)/AIG2-like uncharacterized protein YtfP
VEADGLFVYGSLRAGGRGHGWVQRTAPVGLTPARAQGRLFHLPAAGFPAMVPGPGAWVLGEFIGYEDEAALASALQDLDQVEDVEGGLFQRQLLPVWLDSGHCYQAWAYVFPADRLPQLEREGVELLGGDWAAYLD